MDLALQAVLAQLTELKKDISTGKNQLAACEERLQRDTTGDQEKPKCKICAIRAGLSKFKERITDMLGKQLKGIMTIVNRQAQNLHVSSAMIWK
jgi:hypothetical protein